MRQIFADMQASYDAMFPDDNMPELDGRKCAQVETDLLEEWDADFHAVEIADMVKEHAEEATQEEINDLAAQLKTVVGDWLNKVVRVYGK